MEAKFQVPPAVQVVVPTHNDVEIPPWSSTGKEYLVLSRFPHLRRRLEGGRDCLCSEQREQLHHLCEKRKMEGSSSSLHGKVSLLAGGNLAHVKCDAVVNASNHWLTTGKGINGTLHSAAGHCLLEECMKLGGCEVGQAKITSGYNLPSTFVIHTVGPEERDANRSHLLRSCYQSVLQLCLEHSIRTVAFSCISTGAYRYPSVEAADIALETVSEWLQVHQDDMDRIVFVTRTSKDEEAYGFLMLSYFPLE